MKEIKVCVLSPEHELLDKSLDELSDEEFMEQGTLYTLEEFEREFNNPQSNLSTEYDMIRFLSV